ncbi:glutamate-5-semialdehyde dehydrogenase [Candidatus Peregrinibacteria bacterium]|nr:glutamate-5-semialdehyde dehydrogenase [Candidatus Peregrinibacteria bacterium]
MSDLTKNLKKVRTASRTLVDLSDDMIRKVLFDLADTLVAEGDSILAENQKDLDKMDENDPKYDRLKLMPERLEGIAADMRNVAKLEYPVGKVLEERTLENGLKLSKITVPLGVIGIIYEARPNVTFDVFSLCFKSGNACVLKGGSDAEFSNTKIVQLIQSVLKKHELDPNIIYLAPSDREAVKAILTAHDFIDVIIPRGSGKLIRFVRENARIPVIETGAGIVHTYFDETADLEMGKKVILNAKTRRPSVCNALDTLIIHQSRLSGLPELVAPLLEHKVELFADEKAFGQLKGNYDDSLLNQAQPEDFGKEFLSLRMSVKTVGSLDEAIEHITAYSSKHSEAILSENPDNIETFLRHVDAACVYANTSTAFTDGAQFGMGAEIGISTQKLHARGPMALKELTSYKWVVRGEGQIRPA